MEGRGGGGGSIIKMLDYRTVVTLLDVVVCAGRCVAALAARSFSASWDPALRFGEGETGMVNPSIPHSSLERTEVLASAMQLPLG